MLPYMKIIGRAAWVRAQAGLDGRDPPYSTHDIIEKVFPNIAVSGTHLPEGITEMAVSDGPRRALFYNNRAGISHAHQRVGLAHGLYHHITDIKGIDGLRECNVVLRQLADLGVGERDPTELACDLFAAELLVPLDVLDAMAPDPLWGPNALPKKAFDDECDHLASRFNVPAEFMRWRLFDLNALRKSHYNPRR